MTSTDKTRESRLRRTVARRGYLLAKNRRRDPNAWDYGLFTIINPELNAVVQEHLSLDGVERWLEASKPRRPASAQ
jgi:hypothetical protein